MSKLKYPKHLKREVSAFLVMHRRCLEPKFRDYPRYGGAGIQICPQWQGNWPQFLADMGPAPSPKHWLGRLDVTKGYWPWNVIWTTQFEQVSRRAYCRKVPISSVLMTIAQAERVAGLEDGTLRQRLNAGWTMGKALTAKRHRTGRPRSSKSQPDQKPQQPPSE